MYGIGLMSGTSLDGIDAVLLKIDGSYTNTKISVINFITMPIPDDIKKSIKLCCDKHNSSVETICSTNFKMGYLFADAVKNLCIKSNFPMDKLDYIASHGQTIYHIPIASEFTTKSTLQIGEPAIIAYETKTTTISNFRSMDIADGGDGAPLVPYADFILYGNKHKNLALQNIGGIGNVTVIPKSLNIDDVFAFDTGPGNMIIDEACQILFDKKYDDNGDIAKAGNIDNNMLDYLMQNKYLYITPPKSTGREIFGEYYTKSLLDKYKNMNKYDIIATLTMFTAKTIAHSYEKYIFPKIYIDEIIISGGGAYNNTLLDFIRCLMPNKSVLTQESYGYSSDAKEAIAFAILGNETLCGNYSNVPSATGAKNRLILGSITNSPFL